MKRPLSLLFGLAALVAAAPAPADAFCGFFVVEGRHQAVQQGVEGRHRP